MIAPELLQILRCPETMQPVRIATGAELQRFADHELARTGAVFEMAHALIREDGKVLYPIRNGIPVMLLEEAVSIA